MARSLVVTALGLILLAAGGGAADADDGWNPFKSEPTRRQSPTQPVEPDAARQRLPPMGGIDDAPWRRGFQSGEPPPAPVAGPYSDIDQPSPWSRPPPGFEHQPLPSATPDTVQRGDLQPVMAADGSGMPYDMWQGLDTSQLQELMAPLVIPPRSVALADLWRQMWTSESSGPSVAPVGGAKDAPTSRYAVRLEALYRSGLVSDLLKLANASPRGDIDPVAALLTARAHVLLGDREAGCSEIKGLQRTQSGLPKAARHEFLVLAALCGASRRDAGAAGLAADLLRSEGVDAPVAIAALDAIAIGAEGNPKLPETRTVSLLDFHMLELAGIDRLPELVAKAEPALLAALASSSRDPATRILAGETAASLHALAPAELAAVYRSALVQREPAAEPPADRSDAPINRAIAFNRLEAERSPLRRARLARALLDDARRARGPYMAVAAMLAPPLESLQPTPEIAWFAETAIEVNLAAGRYDMARRWAVSQANERAGGLGHWLALADIADPQWRGRRGENLAILEQMAVHNRLAPELMHRLVTVLDALDYQIPIPLWEAASRTPQPSSGHLPATGILSEMQQASKQKAFARVLLLAMRTLGPDSGDTAHIIALGDTIRALKRAGLEPAARQLGLEALFAAWPRSAHN